MASGSTVNNEHIMRDHFQIGSHRILYRETVEAFDDMHSLIGEAADRFLLVSDDIVFALHGVRLLDRLVRHAPVIPLIMPSGEGAKSFGTLSHLCEEAVAAGATRRSVIVALGGGVVGNVAGLLATLVYRGLRLIHVPTTLLAAADSVISLKSAVNSAYGKNTFGSYIAPAAIVIDAEVFSTLPKIERLSGLAELAKNILTVAPHNGAEIETLAQLAHPWPSKAWLRMIAFGASAKLALMYNDPHEQGPSVVFEYGHTIGHAIELADLEHRGADGLKHGLSVAVGMRAAALIAEDLGVAAPGLVNAHQSFLHRLGVPTELPSNLSRQRIINLVLRDNKRGRLTTAPNEVPMILLHKVGRVAGPPALPLVPVPIAAIERVLARLEEG